VAVPHATKEGLIPPNIISILADDMGYGDFSAINGGLSHTPVLDGLMREALQYVLENDARLPLAECNDYRRRWLDKSSDDQP